GVYVRGDFGGPDPLMRGLNGLERRAGGFADLAGGQQRRERLRFLQRLAVGEDLPRLDPQPLERVDLLVVLPGGGRVMRAKVRGHAVEPCRTLREYGIGGLA